MKRKKASPKTRRSRPGLNDETPLFVIPFIYTAGGVGELYQRRSTLL
jgi:hypothetical protein